jgi:hypothetical protein
VGYGVTGGTSLRGSGVVFLSTNRGQTSMFILVTYKRPERLREFWQQAKANGMNTPGVVLLQGEDLLESYKQALEEKPENWDVMASKTNVGWVAGVNSILELKPREEWYGALADDHLPMTFGWDKKLSDACGPWDVVSCADNSREWTWRTGGVNLVGGDLARTVGWIYPPCTWHICGDDWWQLAGKALSCWKCVVDVRVHSRSPVFAGYEWDETQKTGYAQFQQDLMKYHRWLGEHGGDVLEKLRVVMQARGVLPNRSIGRFVVSDET